MAVACSVGSIVFLGTACFSSDPDAPGRPDAGVETDGAPIATGVPPGCDPTTDVRDAPKCVVNDYGVFVDAAGGSDANAGTKEMPVQSITAALGKLAGRPRIYACDGTYAEHVKITSAVSIYGGFTCGSWSYGGTKAKIAPADRGVALTLGGASNAVVLADLDVAAQDASDPGEASVAVFVSAGGAGGSGGPGGTNALGTASSGAQASAGVDGIAQDVFELQ